MLRVHGTQHEVWTQWTIRTENMSDSPTLDQNQRSLCGRRNSQGSENLRANIHTHSTANVSFCSKLAQSLYGGKSIRLKHVWLLGSWEGSPDFSMVNLRGPSLPWRSLKPLTGIRLDLKVAFRLQLRYGLETETYEVPVANCKRRDLRSGGQLRTHFQNHCITSSFIS